jgi:hypothetical protein
MPGWIARQTTNPVLRQGIRTYFLAKAPVTAAFHYLLALCTILFVIWPKSQFLRLGSPPLTFNILAIVATLVVAYLSFGYGANSLAPEADQHWRAWLVGQHLRPGRVLLGLGWLTLAHSLFLLALALPLLLAAAHVSGLTMQGLARALLLMLTCTLAYRWIGILTLCCCEQQEFLRYVVARGAFVLLVLGSAFFLPPVNPLLGLISLTFGDELGQVVTVFGQQLSFAVVSLIIHLLLLMGTYIMVRILLQGWLTQPSTPDPMRDRGTHTC